MTLFVFFGVAALLQLVEGRSAGVKACLYVPLILLCIWNIGVLEVTLYSWQTGVGLEGAETHRELFEVIRTRWFGE